VVGGEAVAGDEKLIREHATMVLFIGFEGLDICGYPLDVIRE
jgi:hypothetical protein